MIDVTNTLAAVEEDGGTGRMIGDPLHSIAHFHLGGGVRILPIIRRPLPGTDAPPQMKSGPETVATPPPPTPEQQVESGTSLNNASAWSNIAQGFGPAQSVLSAINGAASNGGANQMLGPQMDFAPADGGGSSGGGGGMGIFLFIAVAIVGVLVWMHFRKKHAKAE